VNDNEVCDLPHCFNKGSINWVQCDTCTRWLHTKCAGLSRQAAVQCEKYIYSFFANNGFFSIKSQGVSMHVCINQGITATSMNLMLNAQHSLSGMNNVLRACFCFNAVYTDGIWVFCIGSFAFSCYCNNVYLCAIFHLAVECCVHLPRSSNVLLCSSATFLECSYQYCMRCWLLAMLTSCKLILDSVSHAYANMTNRWHWHFELVYCCM